MVTNHNQRRARGSAIDDIAYLARSEHRVPTLVALTDRSRSRAELCELFGVSSSTIRRTIGEFEDRNWIRKERYQYVTTELGEAIASGMEDLIGQLETERKLRDVWHWLPGQVIEFAIENGSETTVTVAEYDAPYRPVNRFRSLLLETTRFQFLGIDVALLEPCREEFRRRVLDGMQTEIVNPPSVAEYVISTYPELCFDILESGSMTALLHDDVPTYGISLFDQRIGVNGYDPDSGAVKVFLDTDIPEAREWAESIYAEYRAEARPLEAEQIVG